MLLLLSIDATPASKYCTSYRVTPAIDLQVPMVIVTEWLKRKIKKPLVGNVIFWISFCIIGQPLCMIMYYHDYVHFHMSQQQIPIPKMNMVPIPGTSMEYNG